MKKTGFAVTAAATMLLSSGLAFAQTTETNQPATSPAPAAVNVSGAPSKTMAAPVPGRNSFTEKQATGRLHKFGYRNVKDLKLDAYQVWRGQATKAGVLEDVSVDYQGNVTGQPASAMAH